MGRARGRAWGSGPEMKALVTGGGGFLGRKIVELLLANGHTVRILARSRYPGVEALGAQGIEGDIRDRRAVEVAVNGVDVVFHAAAKTGYWGSSAEYWSINLEGTRQVLEAVRRAGVHSLIYTSTPSVVGYARDVKNGGSDLPHAAVHEAVYPESKAAAERLVLEANGSDVCTLALRPHLIIGPGDSQLMPRIVRRASSSRMLIVGDGLNTVDLTYVDNAAWAHLDAVDALTGPHAACAGRAYFISNGEPVLIWEWLNELLEQLGIPPITRSVPLPAARLAGGMAELTWKALRLSGEPVVTRFLASTLARSHWYDLGPARRDLGYTVRVPMDEATRRTTEWLSRTAW